MRDIYKFLVKYKRDVIINYYDDCVIISAPFFYHGHDEGIAIRVTENDGMFVLSDCHTVEDYLEAQGIELEEFGKRLEKIIKRYYLIHDGNVFRMIVPNPTEMYFERYFGYFIQALSVIANIDL